MAKRLKSLWIILLILSIEVPSLLHAQKRPKVAVVLSGGGAKGMAHIGFLKVMEEAGLRPDIITGTSMGSIVAGLYSIGYTVEELEEIGRYSDWEFLFANYIDLRKVSIEEKDYYERIYARFSY